MALAGVSDVYASGSELLKAFLGLHIASSQLYRVTNLLGEQITAELLAPVEHPPLAEDEVVYASVDGSMVLTDEGWQEPGRRSGQGGSGIHQSGSGRSRSERR